MNARTRVILTLLLITGCPPPPDATTPMQVPQDCPEAPAMMSVTEAADELARFARETRANLMARLELPAKKVEQSARPDRGIFVTLHPPGLTLLEAVLASPGKAQQLDQTWLQGHLLRAHVDLHAGAQPLESLAGGDLSRVALVDGQGQRHPAVYMTLRGSGSGGWVHRFFFDPLAFDPERDRTRIRFEAPVGGDVARTQWQMSRATLSGMDELPLLYLMRRRRAVRLARWAVLMGDRSEARAMLDDELACAPDLTAATDLLRALDRLAPRAAQSRSMMLRPGTLTPSEREELGHDPLADLALRSAMLARLTPLTGVGVVSAQGVKHAQQALSSAVKAVNRGTMDVWALAAALVDFDRALATLLEHALDGRQVPSEAVSVLTLEPSPKVSDVAVTRELERRLLYANYDLTPRWVKGPPGHVAQDGRTTRVNLIELRATVQAEEGQDRVVAELRQRMGWGWLHPGLPAQRYRVQFVDHSEEYWRIQVGRVTPATSIEAHRPLALQMIHRELFSPSPRAMQLAMAAIARQQPPALDRLFQALEHGSPEQQAAALKAVALVRDPRVGPAVARAARASDAAVRVAAMRALGARGVPAEIGLLRAQLDDSDPRVAQAATLGLLQNADATGILRVRRVLLGSDAARRDGVLGLQGPAAQKLKLFARELVQLSMGANPSLRLPAALVRALGPRALPHLLRIYDNKGSTLELRVAVLSSATDPGFERLLTRAALEDGPPQLKRAAVLGLSRFKTPPVGVLQKSLQDPDPLTRLAAQVGLSRLGQVDALLALGLGARGSCEERAVVLPTLCQSMDASSRGRLLVDALNSGCTSLWPTVWALGMRYQPRDLDLLRAALSHPNRVIRVQAALAVLGQRSEGLVAFRPDEG